MTTQISFQSIQKLFKKGRKKQVGHNPQVDWIIIFSVGCCVAIAYGTWSVLIYSKLLSGKMFAVDTTTEMNIVKLNVTGLTTVTERYQSHQTVPEIAVPDPSK